MTQLFTNNAYSALAGAITDSATTITLTTGTGSKFPTPTGGDYFLLTLIGLDSSLLESSWEVIKVTARSTDTLTVVRAQDTTTALAWASGTRAELRITAATLNTFMDSAEVAAAYLALSGGTLTGALVGTSVTAKKNVLTPVALTSSGGSIAIDLADSNFTHTLTENTVLANPTNLTPGQSGRIKLTNHASSPKTLAFGSYWLPVGGVVQSLTASNSAVDLLVYEVDSATTITFKLLKDRK